MTEEIEFELGELMANESRDWSFTVYNEKYCATTMHKVWRDQICFKWIVQKIVDANTDYIQHYLHPTLPFNHVLCGRESVSLDFVKYYIHPIGECPFCSYKKGIK